MLFNIGLGKTIYLALVSKHMLYLKFNCVMQRTPILIYLNRLGNKIQLKTIVCFVVAHFVCTKYFYAHGMYFK